MCSPFVQLYFVLKYGTYLAQRWEETPVDLYHMPGDGSGFFVEVGTEYEQPLVLRSFVSSMPLEDYSHYVELPEGWS
ncbi:MAG: hypothetical protein EOO61_15415 [Hymenobacter sp.]|nr:MAG: hypothetical protein EOO61_15415 [Hymenobacter sp.]